jgi:hypothetical protein
MRTKSARARQQKEERALHTLVPTLDHLANADLSDKGVIPDECKIRLVSGEDD